MLKVLFVYSDGLCSTTRKRCIEPYQSLILHKKNSIETKLINYLFFKEQHILENDIIIMQRFGANSAKISQRYENELFSLIKKYPEKRFIYDIDDLVFYYNNSQPIRFMENCTEVITTCKPIEEKIKLYNKNVHIVKNYIDKELFDSIPKSDIKCAPVNISWFSGNGLGIDLMREIIDILEYKYLNKIIINFFGIDPFNSYIKNWNKKIINTYGFIDFQSMFSVLKTTDILINPMDLNDMTFQYIGIGKIKNREEFLSCKSDIKYIKAGISGIPIIATPNPQYEESIKNGINGYLANNKEQWIEYLSLLIENEELRKNIGKNAYEDVCENYTLKNLADKYEKILIN